MTGSILDYSNHSEESTYFEFETKELQLVFRSEAT